MFLGKTFSELSYEMFEGLLVWFDLPKNTAKCMEKLNNMKSKHPAEKKKEAQLRSQNTAYSHQSSTIGLRRASVEQSESPTNEVFE